jgi:protein involved in polysaccharide export with SLBB domain
MRRNFTSCVFYLLFIFLVNSLYAQQTDYSGTDLSQIKVEELSDDQIEALLKKAEQQGLSEQQLESLALSRGMSQSDLVKFRKRIQQYKSKKPSQTDSKKFTDRSRTYQDSEESESINKNLGQTKKETENETLEETDDDIFNVLQSKKKERLEDKIFGFSLFNRRKISFETNLNIATPQNYQLGPKDEIIIDIWGASQETYKETISPDGSIFIDNLGLITLNGFTIEEATRKLTKSLASIYAGLNSGNTFLKISLGSVRSIKVNIVGDVFLPGTYTLPSLASVFNALYAAGGPSLNGCLRNIKVIRDNKKIADLDFYDFLLKGELPNNIRLQDQDVIFVSPYQNRVELKGEVKRPFFYDMLPNETVSDLLQYSGGFSGKAYNSRIKIIRKTGQAQKIFDISNLDTLLLANGDEVTVDSVLNRFENRVNIKGAINRPGFFSLESNLTLKQLIKKAEGIRGDAFLSRISIYRIREDYTVEAIPVDLNALLLSSNDVELKREDVVVIPSIYDIREEYFIKVEGEVKQPGEYVYVANSSIEDIILQAGGLLESASMARVEVARRIKNPNALTTSANIAEVFQFSISENLRLSNDAKQFTLQPFDYVFIRRSPGYETQSLISLEGELLFPGKYSLIYKNERISDIIKRSGGLTPEAFPKGAKLIRQLPVDAKARQKALETIRSQSNDSIKFIVELDTISAIGINLDRIMENPGSKYDLILQEGDILKVPKELQTVRLSGQVLSPVLVRYNRGKGFKNYVSNAGGFAPDAKQSKSYIIYANGTMDRTRKILFFNSYPKVEPGAEIIVPKKAIKQGMTTGETVAIGTALSSMALIIVSIINSTK